MKILNGKKSTLVFQLDNGEYLRVPPGKFSEPFVGTLSMIRAITSSGKPNEVGFVVSNSYELSVLNDVPVANTYYHATEEDAIKVIIEGKDFSSETKANPDTVRIAKLEADLAEAKSQLEAEKQSFKEKHAESEKQLEKVNDELSKELEVSGKLKAEIENLKVELTGKDSKIESLTEQIKSSAVDSTKVDALSKELSEVKSQLESATSGLNELKAERDTLKAELEAKSAEYDKVTEDAKTVIEKYNSAAQAVRTIMQKFKISYVDGEYVQTV